MSVLVIIFTGRHRLQLQRRVLVLHRWLALILPSRIRCRQFSARNAGLLYAVWHWSVQGVSEFLCGVHCMPNTFLDRFRRFRGGILMQMFAWLYAQWSRLLSMSVFKVQSNAQQCSMQFMPRWFVVSCRRNGCAAMRPVRSRNVQEHFVTLV